METIKQNFLSKKNISVLGIVLVLTIVFLVFPTEIAEASSADVLERQIELQEEFRFWEVRTELHRIHHHLEYVPYMSFAVVGIFLVHLAFLVIKIIEMRQKRVNKA
ncbi:hypothetical protein PRVXT_000772 [Proteinivorax tanatarense]|uniref:Uncharacterized protein n=1 Tax=Proteinivorax tanatarense TaxID=1260629 RepID=A0AAU7VP46_9FIRM